MPRSPSPYSGQRRRGPEVSPPDYMDEYGGRHHQPAQDRSHRPRFEGDRTADRGGMRGAFDAVKNFISENTEDRDRPRRAKSYRDPRPRPPPPESDSDDAPPRRRRASPPPRTAPRSFEAPPTYDDYDDPNRPQRRRRPREDDYYSDSRHDRPRRDTYDERPRRRDDYAERPRRRDYDDRYDDRPRRRDPYDDRYDDRPRRRDDYDRPRRGQDRYDDRMLRDPRDSRMRDRRRGGNGVPEWQRQAKDMFYTHALPVIKKEGPKLIAKYAGGFLAGKQGGSGR